MRLGVDLGGVGLTCVFVRVGRVGWGRRVCVGG